MAPHNAPEGDVPVEVVLGLNEMADADSGTADSVTVLPPPVDE